MRKIFLIFTMSFLLCTPYSAGAQSAEIQQLILNIEKLSQFKKILSDMKKGYDMLNGGYKAVKDMSEGNFSLHKTFLDALMQVSPVVKNYKRVGDIVEYQFTLIRESRKGIDRILKNEQFSPKEIQYFEKVYSNLSRESLRNIDELTSVIAADKLRMTDDERLEAIDRIYDDMQQKILFLRDFNGSSSILALQRSKESNDAKAVRSSYHFKD
ncbi:TerB family tellurite resistance protein [Flavobacterium humidisoli]|uniref:TerB family tellurite resistance protein n=1 Tax=Flavobacterium humidisoli TaxID=2937442 RepID=A0ABY4M280_9FLAO|nr:TerB family tellurite resistance protein [Flavobacterium humidisoli]UPZ17951.1 TerB family tellurite resistance protein [Flavobacterium humidisoli]